MAALRCAAWMPAVVTVLEKDAARPKDTADLRLSQISYTELETEGRVAVPLSQI